MLRRYGRGSVYLRKGKRNSTWYGRWWQDSADGKRRYRKVRLGDVAEIPDKRAARRELEKRMGTATVVTATTMTFSDLCDRWLEVHRQVLKPSTFSHYEHAVKKLRTEFAGPVAAVDRHRVERWVLELARQYAKASVRSLLTTLGLVMKWAQANSWVEKNPTTGIRLPRSFGGRRVERVAIDRQELQRLLTVVEDSVIRVLVEVMFDTGIRISEAAGLRWSDLEPTAIVIRQRVYGARVDELKSRAAQRRIPISREMVEKINQLEKRSELIFAARNGAALNPKNWMLRYVRPAAEAAGVGLRNWHSLRHSAVVRWRKLGVAASVIARLCGHSKVQLHQEVYDHVDEQDLRLALSREMNPTEPKSCSAGPQLLM